MLFGTTKSKVTHLSPIRFPVILGHFLLMVKSISVFHMTSVVNRCRFVLIFSFPMGVNHFWWFPLRGLIKRTVIDNVLFWVWPLAVQSSPRAAGSSLTCMELPNPCPSCKPATWSVWSRCVDRGKILLASSNTLSETAVCYPVLDQDHL